MAHEQYYYQNQDYTAYLNEQPESDFFKYVRLITTLTNKHSQILDLGSGTGIALQLLKKNKRTAVGVDISKTSIEHAQQLGLEARSYDGKHVPYPDEYFDVVGSYNVLEHTDNPVSFLDESLRLVKPSGYVIVVCPNFLSITNNYHHHTKGFRRKVANILQLIKKASSSRVVFEKMPTLHRHPIQPDDDACNVTNPIDIRRWAKSRGLQLVYWSCQSVERDGIFFTLIDKTPLRLIFGSSALVFKK